MIKKNLNNCHPDDLTAGNEGGILSKRKDTHCCGKIPPLNFVSVGMTVLVVALLFSFFRPFNPQAILDSSVLKDKNFNASVIEIKSPQHNIKAYYFFDNTNPIVSVDFLFNKAGLSSDNPQQIGISNLVSTLLTEDKDLKEELAARAISISYESSLDYLSGNVLFIKKHQEKAVEFLAQTLNPDFKSEDINRVKNQQLFMLKKQQENPSSVLSLEFNKNIFKEHPYERNPIGSREGIASVTRSDLHNFIKTKFAKDNLIVGIAGDISVEEAKALLDSAFGSLPSISEIKDIPNAELVLKNVNISKDIAQTVSAFAGQGVARLDEDFYPLYVVNHILGGSGLTSRLSTIARENEGLTYGIYTYLSLNDKANLIKGGFAVLNENLPRMLEIVRTEWDKIGKNGVSEKELEQAKNYLISSYNLRFASISDISSMLMIMQKENLGIDFLIKRNSYVQNVKLSGVNRVAKVYFNPNNLMFVNLGED